MTPTRPRNPAIRDRTPPRLLIAAAVGLGLAAPAAAGPDRDKKEDAGADPSASFPWRADKQGDVMLLQKLSYREDGKPRHRESVVRVIPAARVEPVPKGKVPATRLAKVRRKEAAWHVQKDGSVVLLQRRIGVSKAGKPAAETALVARIPAQSAGSFADVRLAPPPAGGRGTYWSRDKAGAFVLYQGGRPLPLSGLSASRLASGAYLDEDYDGTLEDSEVYDEDEVGYLEDLDEADGDAFDDDEDDFDDDDGDGLDEDDDLDDDDEAMADDDGDDDEDGDLDDDGDD